MSRRTVAAAAAILSLAASHTAMIASPLAAAAGPNPTAAVTAVDPVTGPIIPSEEAPTPGFVARSVAAGAPVTDAEGNLWRSRDGFLGGTGTSSALRDADVAGTTDDALYRLSAYELTGYTMGVPAPGRYEVRLLMAEGYWDRPGQRVFDVTAEGLPALSGVDIVAEAGKGTAHDRRFDVNVTDGRLDLRFVRRVDNPLIAAVEVRSLELSPPRGYSVRAAAGRSDVVDAQGRTWSARSGWRGGDRLAWELVGHDISGTVEDALYATSRTEPTGWSTSLPDGRYRVTLRMAEGYWWKAGQRVFDVSAQGRLVLPGVDIVGAVGRGRAYERSVDVDVAGGQLQLGFHARVDHPLIAAIEVEQLDAPGAGQRQGRAPIPLSSESFFVQRVDGAPLDPRSAAKVRNLHQDVVARWNGVAAVNAMHYNVSFVTVPPGQPRVDVGFVDCQKKGYVPWDIHQGEGYFLNVPIPDDAQPTIGEDRQLTVYDPSTEEIWEFWQAARNPESGQWTACWGGRIDYVSTQEGIYKQGYGVAATGILMAPGMISLEDVRSGSIDHALYLAVPRSQPYPKVSWPARRGDGYVADPDVVLPGQRVRLDPSIDVSTLHLTPVGRMVAEAAQRYGFIIADTGPAVAVVTEDGRREAAQTGVNPWGSLLGVAPHEVLRGFPWDRMQAVVPDYGRPTS